MRLASFLEIIFKLTIIFLENDARSRLKMTQIRPSLYPSHINVFSWKKSQSIIICKYITDT